MVESSIVTFGLLLELDELPLLLPDEEDSLLWLLSLDALELDGHDVDELLPSLEDWL